MRRGAAHQLWQLEAERLNKTRKAIDASPASMRQMPTPTLRRSPAPKSPWPATGSAALCSRLRRKQLTKLLIEPADGVRVSAERRLAEPAIAFTAIGADIATGRATP
jgi:hypothetical protein